MFEQLTKQLKVWDGRRRLRDAVLLIPKGLLIGLLLAVLLAAVARLRPFLTNSELTAIIIGLALLGLLIATILVLRRRHTVAQQARFADAQFDLKARTSTAVELAQGKIEAPATLVQEQLAETLTAVSRVDTNKHLPINIEQRDWAIILLAIILLAISLYLPNPQAVAAAEQRAVAETIDTQIEALQDLIEEVLDDPVLTDDQSAEVIQSLESAQQGLEASETREEAVATLSEAEAELRDLAASNSNEQLETALESAGEPLADSEASQSLGEALQNGDLAEAGAEAAQLADDLAQLDENQHEELAQDLAETAAQLEGTDDELSDELSEAAEALENGDIEGAQEALQDAAATLQQRNQEQAAAAATANAASELQEGRQEVAEAGQQGQQGQVAEGAQQGQQGQQGEQGQQGQQGQGQQGQGQGQGQGAGEGQGQGGGSGGQEGGEGGGAGGPGSGGGQAEELFVPDFVDLSGEAGVDVELPAECVANPEQCGGLLNETPTDFTEQPSGSTVPYDQVFGDYRNAANEALDDDYIPLGLRGTIRDYFSSLEPDG